MFRDPLTGVRTPRNVLYMETTTFTAADVAAFAELIRPRFEEFVTEGMSLKDTAAAAAMATKVDEERAMMRRYNMLHVFTDALSGTYDEFRAGV